MSRRSPLARLVLVGLFLASAAPQDEAPPEPSAEELASAHWVEGHVVIPADTPPEARVTVVARGRRFKGRILHSCAVGEDGAFRVAFSERTRKGRLELESDWLHLPVQERFAVSEAPTGHVLEPRLAGRIEGRLAAAPGFELDPATLAGTVVGLFQSPSVEEGGLRFPLRRTAVLSAEGSFVFPCLPVDDPFDLACAPPGWAGVGISDLALVPGRTRTIEWRLVPEARILGSVRDTDGTAVGGVEVTARCDAAASFLNWVSAETAADGTFVLRGLAPGSVELVVEGSGILEHEEILSPLAQGEERTDVVLEVSRGGEVAGRVTWADGTSASHARIVIGAVPENDAAWRELGLYRHQSVTADDEGCFRATGLGPGPYVLEAVGRRPATAAEREAGSARYVERRLRREPVAAGTQDLVLILGEGLALLGRVVDEDGNPLVKFTVRATRADAADGEEIEWRFVIGEEQVARTFSEKDGSFRLEGLTPGRWAVRTEASGFAPSETTIVTLPGMEGELVLVARRFAQLTGRVVDAEGGPVVGAEVQVIEPDRPVLRAAPSGTTNPSGRFVLRDLLLGGAIVSADAPGHAPAAPLTVVLEPGSRAAELVLTLRRGATLTGTVFDLEGRPVPQAEVDVSLFDDRPDLEWTCFVVHTDDQGRYRFTDLAPGHWYVSADLTTTELATLFPGDDASREREGLVRGCSVDLEEGEERRLDLRPKNADAEAAPSGWIAPGPPVGRIQVHGRFLVEGAPVSGAEIGIEGPMLPEGPRGCHVDEDGVYRLGLDEPGEYRIRVCYAETELWRTVTVPDLPDVELDLLFAAGTVRGMLLDEVGRPIAGAFVHLRPTTGYQPGWGHPSFPIVRTREDGTFLAERVLPATYDVHAVVGPPVPLGSGIAEVRRRGIEVPPGDVGSDVLLTFEDTAVLEVSVRDAQGEPALAANVLLWDGEGRPLLLYGSVPAGLGRPLVVRGISEEQIHVAAYHDDVTSPVVSVGPGPRRLARVDLEMKPGAFVELTGRDARGERVLQPVHLEDERGCDFNHFFTLARMEEDADESPFLRMVIPWLSWSREDPYASGEIRIGPLPRGTYLVRQGWWGSLAEDVTFVVGEERELAVELLFR